MSALHRRLIPFVFVFIWSTGFIVARYGMPYAEPMTFLFLRFCGVLMIMLPLCLLFRVQWPARRQIAHIALAGMLLQAGYLGGVWAAIKLGMSASLSALIVGLQPIITAWLGALVAEKVTGRQWLGLCAGLTDAPYTTTTEVYPDSPRATPEQCVDAQVASVVAAIDYALADR